MRGRNALNSASAGRMRAVKARGQGARARQGSTFASMARTTTALVSFAIAATALAACKPAQPSAEYLAACEGPPLRTIERRQQAMQDGYDIDRRYDCITRASFKALAEEKGRWQAANTPEARAAQEAERQQRMEEAKVRREAQAQADADARAERERGLAAAEQAPVERVEINTATESQLASVPGMDAEVARQIVTERAKARFTGWDDVVRRVAALGAAETAVRASAFGLTVNGRGLEGAEPDSSMARFARDKWRRRDG